MTAIVLRRFTARAVALVVCETALIALAILGSTYLRLGQGAIHDLTSTALMKVLLVTLVCQVCLYYAELYDARLAADWRERFIRIVQALGATSFLLAAMYFWEPTLIIGRGVVLVATFLVIASVLAWRATFDWVTVRIRPRERLLIVGTSHAARALARELTQYRQSLGVEIVGFIEPDAECIRGQGLVDVVGTVDDIPSVVRARAADRVVVSLQDARGRLPMEKLLEMKFAGVKFDHLASVYEEYTGKIAVENLRPSWFIFANGFSQPAWVGVVKRLFDIVVSAAALIVAAPIMACVALAVRFTSPGPVLFHQRRVGLMGRVFTVHKFRSMRQDAEAGTGPVWARMDDPRVTPFGRFMRSTRLDELPQLWNVLIGEMSLVGPRPERPEFVQQLSRQINYYSARHSVRPGLTGWAQVRYSYGSSTEDALQKLQYELFYIKHMSLQLDFFVLFETVRTVLFRRGH